MGRKPLVNIQQLENKLLIYGSTIFVNGKLNYNSTAWFEIAKEMNYAVKPYSLYLTVSQNRYNILNNLKKNVDFHEVQEGKQNNYLQDKSESEMESDTLDTESDTDSQFNRKCVLNLDIPYDAYLKMKPITVQYGENNKIRNYDVLNNMRNMDEYYI